MALLITCPNCGSRAYTEYWFGGELPAPPPAPGAPADAGTRQTRYRRWARQRKGRDMGHLILSGGRIIDPANGRDENQRVEIVVMGDPIGNVPFWDKTYALK